jgi:hypothetical protein
MNPGWGQFFMTQRGQFRMAFDTLVDYPCAWVTSIVLCQQEGGTDAL